MNDRDRIERLDELVDAALEGRRVPTIEPELALLALVASDLVGLPDRRFRERLRGELVQGKEKREMETATATTSVRPYFIVEGADELIGFLEKVLHAELVERVPAPGGTVMHAHLRVGDSVVEMGDAGSEWTPIGAAMHVYLEDVDAAYQRALAAGVTSLYEPVDQPYGDREAGVVDRFGIEWFLATRLEGGARPPGYGMVTTSLRANGASDLLSFLRQAFGAEHVSGTMEHAELRLGETMFELSEAHGKWGPTRGAFHIFVEDCDAAYAAALAAGAETLYPPEDKPYGERSAGVTDPWGNQWFIATPLAG